MKNGFVRKLASNDRRTRERTFKVLKQFLSSESNTKSLKKLELEKLWKGLFYTMWFSDRPLPQKRLATSMSQLFSQCISPEKFPAFVSAFWYIMSQEWSKVDKWRVDKYLLLMRYVVKECFEMLKQSEYEEKLLYRYIDALENGILSGDVKLAGVIVFHIVDVWLDEIEEVLFEELEDEDEDIVKKVDEKEAEKHEEEVRQKKREIIANAPIDKLLEPMVKLYNSAPQKGLKKRILENVFEDDRLAEWGIDGSKYIMQKKRDEEISNDEDEEWHGF